LYNYAKALFFKRLKYFQKVDELGEFQMKWSIYFILWKICHVLVAILTWNAVIYNLLHFQQCSPKIQSVYSQNLVGK
jgi:hypothetical protein